ESPSYGEGDVTLARALGDHAALAILKARARREAELAKAALVRANEAHQMLFDSNPVPMFFFDIDTLACIAVNDAALALYGYSRDEFLRLRASDLRASTDADDLARSESDASGRTVH